jgi:hypothetical protein
MIKVRASLLESVRLNPEAYGQLFATGGLNNKGGTHGMFQCFGEVARSVHVGELNMREAITALHTKFLSYRDIPANKQRQERLTEQLMAYIRLYRKMGFNWVDGPKRIQWPITKQVMLTGNTPWVVSNDEGYTSYMLAEKSFDWKSQLRFPLFQQYLASNTIDCPSTSITTGYYFADTNTFDLVNFGKSDMKLAIDETGKLFNSVYREYEKKKSGK